MDIITVEDLNVDPGHLNADPVRIRIHASPKQVFKKYDKFLTAVAQGDTTVLYRRSQKEY